MRLALVLALLLAGCISETSVPEAPPVSLDAFDG